MRVACATGTLPRLVWQESWARVLFDYATIIDAERLESFNQDDRHLSHLRQLAMVLHEPKGLQDEVRYLRERIVRSPNHVRPSEDELRRRLARGVELITARVIGGPKE